MSIFNVHCRLLLLLISDARRDVKDVSYEMRIDSSVNECMNLELAIRKVYSPAIGDEIKYPFDRGFSWCASKQVQYFVQL